MPTLEELNKRYKEIEKENNTPSLSPFSDNYDTANSKLSEVQLSSAKDAGILDAVDRVATHPLGISQKEYDEYISLGITPSPYLDYQRIRAEENAIRAKNQSAISKITNSIGQALISEIGLGTIKGFVDIISAPFELLEGENRDWNNAASRSLEQAQNYIRDKMLPIYRKNPNDAWDVTDVGWWASNFPSVMSSISLFVPAAGLTKLPSAASKLFKVGKAADKATAVGKAMGYNKVSGWLGSKVAETAKKINATNWVNASNNARRIQEFGNMLGTAVLSRVAENTQEAREVYNSGIAAAKEKLSSMTDEEFNKFLAINPEYQGQSKDDIAKDLARQAADSAFNADMALVLFDMIQLRGLGNLYRLNPQKATTPIVRRTLAKELNALEKSGAKGVTNAVDNYKLPFRDKFKAALPFMAKQGTEGIEEAWQGVQQQKAKESIDNKFTDRPTYKTLTDYILDPEITSQAFWGWIGGIVFGGGVNLASKAIINKNIDKEAKEKNLSDVEVARRKLGLDSARVEDIESWRNKYTTLKQDVETIVSGRLPENHPMYKDEQGNVRKLSSPEIDYYKQQYIQSFISDLAINSASNGNIGLLYEWLDDSRVQQYLKDNDMADYANITKETIKEAANNYISSLETIYANVDKVNPIIADTLAKQMAKAKGNRTAVNKLLTSLSQEYTELLAQEQASGKENWKDDYETYIGIESQIASIKESLFAIQALEKSLNAFAEKVKKGEVDVNRDRFNSRANIESEIASVKRDIANRIAYIEQVLPFTGEQFVKNKDSIIQALHFFSDTINKIDSANGAKGGEGNLSSFANIADHIKALDDIRNQYAEVALDFQKSNPSKEIVEAYRSYNQYRKEAFIADRELTPSASEIKEQLNDIETTFMFFANNYDHENKEVIRKYLENAKDIDEAFAKLISGRYESKALEEAMDFYDIGKGNRFTTTRDIFNMVKAIKDARNKNTENQSKGTNADNIAKPAEQARKENEVLEKAKEIKDTGSNPVEGEQPQLSQEEIEERDAGIITNPEEIKQIQEIYKDDANQYKEQIEELKHEPLPDAPEVSRRDIQIARIVSQIEEYIRSQDKNNELIRYFVALSRQDSSAVNEAISAIAAVIYNKNIKLFSDLNQEEIANLIVAAIKNKVTTQEAIQRRKNGELDVNTRNTISLLRNVLNNYVYEEKSVEDASAFRALTDEDYVATISQAFDNYIDAVLPSYLKGQGVKTIVDIQRFLKYIFDTVTIDGQLDLETYQVLCKYIELLNNDKIRGALSNKYMLNDASNILNNYSNAKDKNDYIKELLDNFAVNTDIENASQLDRGFRFQFFKGVTDKQLLSLGNKNLYCKLDDFGNIILCYDDKVKDTNITVNVGFLGKVEKIGKDNTGYRLTSKNATALNTEVEYLGDGKYKLKNDDILRELIVSKDPDVQKVLTAISEDFLIHSVTGVDDSIKSSLRENNRQINLKVEALKTALTKDGYLYRFLESTGALNQVSEISEVLTDKNGNYLPIDKINYQKLANVFAKVAKRITDVLYYDSYKANLNQFLERNNEEYLLESLNRLAKNVYDNFVLTYKMQDALKPDSKQTVKVEFNQVGTFSLNFDRSANVSISNLSRSLTGSITSHPVVVFNGKGAITENSGEKYANKAGFPDGTLGILLTSTSDVPMIALLKKSVTFSENKGTPINDAVKQYVLSYITDYYNEGATEKSYDKLLNAFKNLFNSSSIFKGFDLSILNGAFTINQSVTKETPDGLVQEWKPIVTFYKYSAVARNETDANGNQVTNYYEINEDGSRGDRTLNPSVGKFTILFDQDKIIRNKATKGIINKLVDSIANNIRISDRFISNSITSTKVDNAFVTFDKNGTGFTLSIKDSSGKELIDTKNQHYANFTQFIVKNGLYSTTHVGRSTRTMFNSLSDDDKMEMNTGDIRTKIEITSASRASSAIQTFKDKVKKTIKPRSKTTKLNTDQALEFAEYTEQERKDILALNDSFKDKTPIIPINVTFSTDQKFDASGKPVFAVRNKRGITFYNDALDLISGPNGKTELIRLLIHEQFHNNIITEKFLEGEDGRARVQHIIEIYDNFDKFITENKDKYAAVDTWLHDSESGWYTKYKSYKEGNEEAQAKFVNEFLAEVFSNQGLADALNSIDYTGTKITATSTTPTLLQRILQIIIEFFHGLSGEIRDNSDLQEIYNTLGYSVNFEEANVSFTGEVSKPINAVEEIEVVETKEETTSPVEGDAVTFFDEQGLNVPADITSEQDIADYKQGVYDLSVNRPTPDDASMTYLRGRTDYQRQLNEAITEDEDEDESAFTNIIPSETITSPIEDNADLPNNLFTTEEEAALNALETNPKNNPMGLAVVSDMEQYLEQFPPQERAAIRAKLNAGEITYICR